MLPRRGLLLELLAAPVIIRTPGLLMAIRPQRESLWEECLAWVGTDWAFEGNYTITWLSEDGLVHIKTVDPWQPPKSTDQINWERIEVHSNRPSLLKDYL